MAGLQQNASGSVIYGPTHNPKIPSIYQIEAFSRCNLKCPFCLTGQSHEKFDYAGSAMDWDLFQTIVERDLGGSDFIELQMRGEPTLNKKLNEMVCLLQDKVFVGFSTHGGLLHTPGAMAAVLNSHFVTVSIDAGTEKTYNQKRVGGSWTRLLKNLDRLFAFVDPATYPKIDLQLLEIGDCWEQELTSLQDLAIQHGWSNLCRIRSLHNTCAQWENPNVVVINNELCLNPWLSVSIKVNGDVVACCMAFEDDPEITYGNLREQSLEEIWSNESVQSLRRKMLLHAASLDGLSPPLPAVCKQCYSKSPALFHQKLISSHFSRRG